MKSIETSWFLRSCASPASSLGRDACPDNADLFFISRQTNRIGGFNFEN
jgi:hypothetical protein